MNEYSVGQVRPSKRVYSLEKRTGEGGRVAYGHYNYSIIRAGGTGNGVV